MRLLYVTQSYYPFLDKGGPTVKVRALARGLSASGNSVSVLTADYGLTASQKDAIHAIPGQWGYEAIEEGIETIYLKTRIMYRAVTWNPAVTSFCEARLSSFQAVHIFGLYDLMGPRVAGGCRAIGRPYILEPMGMFQPIVRSIRMKRLYHSLLGGPMWKGASRIVATSEQERDELIAGGIPEAKIIVRRNGIDVPAVLPSPGRFRRQWNISNDVKLVLFLGRLVAKKSPDLMLEAFSRWHRSNLEARRSILVVAGPDEGDGFRQHLETLAARSGLNGGVLFTGPLYGEAKWAAYRDADLFVLPSQNENFGNTAAEAVACGTPVLVTDRCGIAPIVDRRAGVVVPHDCDSLEAGLGEILNDPAYAARLREGCANVARSLGWAEPLAEMETLYRDLITEKRAA